MVEGTPEGEKVVAEAVEEATHDGIECGGFGECDHAALGAAAHGAAYVRHSSRRGASGENEAVERRKSLGEGVDLLLEAADVDGVEAVGDGVGVRGGVCRQICAGVEDFVLDHQERFAVVGCEVGVCEQEPDEGVEFVGGSVCVEAEGGFAYARSPYERSGAGVAGAGVDFHFLQ